MPEAMPSPALTAVGAPASTPGAAWPSPAGARAGSGGGEGLFQGLLDAARAAVANVVSDQAGVDQAGGSSPAMPSLLSGVRLPFDGGPVEGEVEAAAGGEEAGAEDEGGEAVDAVDAGAAAVAVAAAVVAPVVVAVVAPVGSLAAAMLPDGGSEAAGVDVATGGPITGPDLDVVDGPVDAQLATLGHRFAGVEDPASDALADALAAIAAPPTDAETDVVDGPVAVRAVEAKQVSPAVPAPFAAAVSALMDAAAARPDSPQLIDLRNESAMDADVRATAAAPDPAAEVARATVTRDTAGTALAAAIIAADPAIRPPQRRAGSSAAPVAGSQAIGEADDGAANTPKPTAGSAAGATVTASAITGIAAAASAFVERLRAISGDRGDVSATPGGSSPGGGSIGPVSLGGTGTSGAMQSGGGAQAQAASAAVLPQLAAEITRRVVAGETRFRIRLDPAELGRVDVRLSLDDAGEARAQLTVDRRETYDLLARDHRGLERTLREAGFEVRDGSVQVTLRQNGDGSSGGGQGAFERFAQHQHQQGQGDHAEGHGGDKGQPASSLPESESIETDILTRLGAFVARPVAGSGRLDIRV